MSYNYSNTTTTTQINQMTLEVKSKYDAEFRRFGLARHTISKFEEFYQLLERLHGLNGIQFNICYTDKDGELLPINNDMNLARVLQLTIGILRLIIQRKGECYNNDYFQSSNQVNCSTTPGHTNTSFSNQHFNANNSLSYLSHNKNLNNSSASYRPSSIIMRNLKEFSSTLTSNHHNSPKFQISYPEDFRPVAAIIDVDILPDTYRRVRLHKHKSSKPLGFYIRDGRSLRVTPQGVEQVPGIFISRLMPGGLAESTGLLSVNDEVIEVNGIEVAGKTLDQVTDMMVANSSNLIITVKPTNQRYSLNRTTTSAGSNSTMSHSNNSSHVLPSMINTSLHNRNLSFKNKKQLNENIIAASMAAATLSHGSNNNTNLKHNNENSEQQQSKNEMDEDNSNQNDDEDEVDEVDEDDDDEEIHDITNHNNSSDQDNSDDKILTL